MIAMIVKVGVEVEAEAQEVKEEEVVAEVIGKDTEKDIAIVNLLVAKITVKRNQKNVMSRKNKIKRRKFQLIKIKKKSIFNNQKKCRLWEKR